MTSGPLIRLDHVNIRTAKLAALRDFYCDVLGMEAGPRPGFAFGGAWLYSGTGAGRQATVHLVEVAEQPAPQGALRLEHFAFAASGLAGFLARLKDRGVAYRIGVIRDFGIVQVNVHDPDGNHIHVDFPAAEAAGIADEPALAGL